MEKKLEHSQNSAPPVLGVPGDIKVQQWFDGTYDDACLDIVTANIFAPSYFGLTSEKRGALAHLKEIAKHQKYSNNKKCIPLAIEVMGGMGIEFKKVLQKIAHRIATRKNKIYSEIMKQTRQQLAVLLMLHNTNMILSSLEL